ncbi:ACP S-malonyltransferase [Candidatus Pelagibacter sp.]|nr:ACP S-malonyltransferase [Candidatus Pelagibacter sp.]
MFAVVFPGQGSQIVGMAKEFYNNFNYVKSYFDNADDILNKKISKIILDGPKNELDQTENTQPAIFLVSYSIFKIIENETKFNLKKAKFFAGHSLGEYSALCCADAITFDQTINLLKFRGQSMQNAVPIGQGGMIAILGVEIEEINKILHQNKSKFLCYVANDNSFGQVVVSGNINSIEKLIDELKINNIKYIKLPVSSPFHCPLMGNATNEMKQKILETNFVVPKVDIVSNVTSKPLNNPVEIKNLLIEQIEKPVRWRESVSNMISFGVNHFIEIGPGKVLSGLIKRIDRNVKLNHVNNLIDTKNLSND